MNHLKADLPEPFDLTEKGCWMLYKSDKTGEHEKHLAEQADRFGLKTIICNADEVQDKETEVEVDVAGGVLYLDDAHLQSEEVHAVTIPSLAGKAGVKFWLNTEVAGFIREESMNLNQSLQMRWNWIVNT